MGNYRYRIEKSNNNYYFALYPNNNPNQEVGRSILYNTYDECKSELENFKIFVKVNKINNYNSKFIRIFKENDSWFYDYKKDNRRIFYRKNGYDQKINAKKIISSIFKNIDANFEKK